MNEELRLKTEKAYNYAVYLLSLKLRTEGELREKLKDKKYNVIITSEVIQKLKQNRYIDDQRYVEVYLENLKKYKTFGFYGIKKKLMEKKLPSNLIEEVLSTGLSLDEELKIAKRFLKNKKIETKQSKDVQEEENSYAVFSEQESMQKQKTSARLKGRGFRSEVISKLIF